MRNILLTDFESYQITKLQFCQVFCYKDQTLYAYNDGITIKYQEDNEDVVSNLRGTLYAADYNNYLDAVEILYHYEKNLLYITLINGDVISLNPNNHGDETIVASIRGGVKASQWSSEQELLAIVTGNDNLLVITKDFDVLTEVELNNPGFREKEIISVGWGKKETQFQGSVGKNTVNEIYAEEITVSDKVRISWRGDAKFFAVSSINPKSNLRCIQIFNNSGKLQYSNELLKGVEDCLDWRPSGNLIASSQRLLSKYNICFFEKNGMIHGEFTLPSYDRPCKVRELLWSKDSKILAVCISIDETSKNHITYIHFYTMSNYKWYCKYTINFDANDTLISIKWDEQKYSTFHVIAKRNINIYHNKYTWLWMYNRSRGYSEFDESIVGVIDGCKVQITAFGRGIIPPPMCTFTVETQSFVNFISFGYDDGSNDLIVGLFTGDVLLYKYTLSDGGIVTYDLIGKMNIPKSKSEIYLNIEWIASKKFLLSIVKFNGTLTQPCLWVIEAKEFNSVIACDKMEIPTEATVALVRTYKSDTVVFKNTGYIYSFSEKDNSLSCISSKKNKLITELEIIKQENGQLLIFALDCSNKFYANFNVLFNNVLSFHVHNKFLLIINMKQELLCLNLEDLSSGDSLPDFFKRKVERGSRLVTSICRDMKVILQMPRGNLESIQPRALSIYVIGKYLDECKYLEAFQLMRKQRINLNLIYDHNPKLFCSNYTDFIDQIEDSQWVSLFISDLLEEDVTKTMYNVSYRKISNNGSEQKSKITVVCHLMEKALLSHENAEKYTLAVLTSYIKRNKIEYLEKCLLKLKDIKTRELQGLYTVVSFNEAFKYLLYLIDIDELYKVALGMYDFDLVLTIAAKSQKDPKEYLPFLNELKKLEPNYQKFTIDKHLKRYNKALTHLIFCDEDNAFNECLNFIKTYELYKVALKLIPSGSKKYKEICACYGEELMKMKKYEEAGIMFTCAETYSSAIEAHKRSGNWREALNCARELSLTQNELKQLYQELCVQLLKNRDYAKAAIIYIDYLKDVEEGIKVLTNGRHFAEALRVCNLHETTNLINTVIIPGVIDQTNNLINQIQDFKAEFERQKDRLQVVRSKKHEPIQNPDEGDMYSDTSTIVTQSYATSRGTNKTYRSAKNKRKHERKLFSLKEGGRYEDLALITSLHNLITNSVALVPEIKETSRFLVKMNNYDLAEKLQNEYNTLLKKLEDSKPEIWTPNLWQNQQCDMSTQTSNDIAATFMKTNEITPALLQAKYAIPPETQTKMKWQLDIFS